MSHAARDPYNPPPYYYALTTKQQRNWRKTARKMQRNEYLRDRYSPFTTSAAVNIFHVHHKTTIESINDLIVLANRTNRYIVDTESDRNKFHNDALIQIQFIHSADDATIILIETAYLPGQATELYKKIKELWCTIFNDNNIIITWGTLDNEFYNFYHLDMINLGNPFQHLDLQSLFREWHDDRCLTHPEMEMRDRRTGPISTNMVEIAGDDDYDDDMDDGRLHNLTYQCDHPSHDDSNIKWSLQDAIASTFEKFLDKSQTVNHWRCGIDLTLETWRDKLFSRQHYSQYIEQEQRQKMKQYATDDCLAVAALYFNMYPEERNDKQTNETPQRTIAQTVPQIDLTPTVPAEKSTNPLINIADELSDISEDELIEILKPKFDKKPRIVHQPYHQEDEVIITTTQNEINELNKDRQPTINTSTPSALTKSERQRKKNLKLKWKQKHRPDFQRKIKRPIYYRYDYRKIRAQLVDDGIKTSHQITINKEKGEVLIGFKTKEEEEKARNIMKINYFSREQYKARWGLNE